MARPAFLCTISTRVRPADVVLEAEGDGASIVSAFQIAYALMWAGGGVLLDLIGTRAGMAAAMIWWCVAHILTGLSNSLTSLGLFRAMLGVGEGCNWPGANKAVAESFPAWERGLATALYDSGSSVGAVIAAPLVSFLASALAGDGPLPCHET